MKKKILLLLLTIAVTVAGCAGSQISNQYISISQYKGIEVPKVDGIPEITEEAVDNNIKTVLKGFSKTAEITQRAAAAGDLTVLNYSATADGQPLEGGNVTNYELELGSGKPFPEFEKAVKGHRTGDTFELEHTFDAADTNRAFAGKHVVFTITVQSVNEIIVPDLTDDFVQTVSQKSDTVAEYREEVRKLLKKNNQDYLEKELEEAAWKAVMEKAKVKKYPSDRLKKEKETFYKQYQTGADTYQMEFKDFLQQMGLTEDGFEKQITKASKANVKEDLAAELIADKASISLSDKAYKKEKKALAEEMKYESVKEMEAEVSEDYIKSYLLRDKVKKWVGEHCVQSDSPA